MKVRVLPPIKIHPFYTTRVPHALYMLSDLFNDYYYYWVSLLGHSGKMKHTQHA